MGQLGKRANLSAVVYLLLCGFCLERFPLPLGAWDGLRYLYPRYTKYIGGI